MNTELTRRRWAVGLRRGWSLSTAFEGFVDDRGVTGAIYTPATYEIDDVGPAIAQLTDAGAKPDATLLWDLAITDIRAAAEILRDAYMSSETTDGYVVVWIDPARANDPEKAVRAAAEVIGDLRRANIAIGLAWVPQRAAVVSRLVAADCPVALSGVGDASARDSVAAARKAGMDVRRAERRKDDPEADVPEVPVFLLGSQEGGDNLYPVDICSEFDVVAAVPRSSGRIPLSPEAEVSAMNRAMDALAQRAKRPPHDDTYTPDDFARSVTIESNELRTDEVLLDIWEHDHTIWNDDPTEISNRLGWLDIAERMASKSKELAEFGRRTRSAADARHIVLLGMGGSSLAAETFASVLGAGVQLTVLDTTHPGHIESVRSSLDLERAIFVVASKSGTTIETRAHLEYFWSLMPRGDRFVAITDHDSELAKLASERGFARTFENDPEIGGRYSALSYFGLVPAALCGIDIEPIVGSARRAMVNNGPGANAQDAGGARLGAALAEAAGKRSCDKLTFVLPSKLASFGDWAEQLIAESTGKTGVGIVPVVGETLAGPEMYGDDRLFCAYRLGDDGLAPQLEALEEHPVAHIAMRSERDLGAEMYRWEMATAIAGYALDINPFDQPDVESAKVRAREALSSSGRTRPEPGDARGALEGIGAPSYIAIQAFIAPSAENRALLDRVRTALRGRHKVAVTVGFGPRFLHSTGQLHKGGPNTGVFVQVVDERNSDIEIPTMSTSFGRLIDAQADGDLLALRDAGRTAVRVSPGALGELTGVGSI